MRKLITLLALLASSLLHAQDTLNGIVNTYARVLQIDPCQAMLIVADATGNFEPGQVVLLHQAKGATIMENNAGDFGVILSLGSAGHFEQNEIKAVSADTVWLRFTLSHPYDTAQAVQLVGMPMVSGPVLLGNIEALPWNGAYGGILALRVIGQASLLQSISVDGLGFGDGLRDEVVSNCNFLTMANAYYYPAGNWRGAPKGEGVAAFIAGKEHGRGPQANGGGGGNDHNSGGGGGANAGTGGLGGKHSPPGTFGCRGNYPGIGGRSLLTDSLRMFFGGEGGNGHIDDHNAGSPGGRGGGIVVLQIDTLIASGQTISANGLTPPLAQGDGAGGGGAGGTIYLQAEHVAGLLHLEARGGNGGDVVNPADRCFGPGGGGGGGRITLADNPFVTVDVSGGIPGKNINPSSQCSTSENGATAGSAGLIDTLFALTQSTEEVRAFEVIDQPASQTFCQGDTATVHFQVAGNFLSFQWQRLQDGVWIDVAGAQQPLWRFPIAANDTVRCVVSCPCMEEVVSESAVLSVNPLPSASFNVWEQGNGTFFFQNTSLHALALLWDFGDGQTASQLDPTHTYEFPGDYLVRLIATNGCGSDTASFTISYHPAPVAAFSATPSMGCAPLTVTFQNLTTGDSLWFEWIFEGGQPATSFETNPEVLYEQPDTFGVTLIAHSPHGSDTLYLAEAVVVHPLPTASFSFEIDSLTVRFTDLSEDAITWLWEFGDGQIATTPNPVHTYAQPGSYDVTLTVTNGPCGNAISTTILVMPSATSTARFPAVRLYPVPARHRLFIEAMEPGSLPLQATLYDVHGRAVRSFAIHASTVEVDVENVPAGLYLLRLCGRDGCMDARLIVE